MMIPFGRLNISASSLSTTKQIFWSFLGGLADASTNLRDEAGILTRLPPATFALLLYLSYVVATSYNSSTLVYSAASLDGESGQENTPFMDRNMLLPMTPGTAIFFSKNALSVGSLTTSNPICLKVWPRTVTFSSRSPRYGTRNIQQFFPALKVIAEERLSYRGNLRFWF